MSLFKPAENTMAYFKAGFMGEAGSEKTHSNVDGHRPRQHLRAAKIKGSEKPVYFLDTEQGSAWVKPMFDDAGIELRVAKTRAFKDPLPPCARQRKTAASSSSTAFRTSGRILQNSYMRKRSEQLKRPYNRLEFQDWAILKRMWREFSDLYVNSEPALHPLRPSRLQNTSERRTSRAARRSTSRASRWPPRRVLGYEPNLLVWMERRTDLATKVVERTAIILKDRSQRLDGEQF